MSQKFKRFRDLSAKQKKRRLDTVRAERHDTEDSGSSDRSLDERTNGELSIATSSFVDGAEYIAENIHETQYSSDSQATVRYCD